MNSWMDGSQSQSAHFGEELNLLSLQVFEPYVICLVA